MSDDTLVLEPARVTSGRLDLTLVAHPRDPDGAVRPTWQAKLSGSGIAAEIVAPEAPDEERSLAQYFDWLYEGRQGFWDAPRSWQSEFGSLQLSAMHDDINTVNLAVQMRGGVRPHWTATIAMPMDPGRFHRLGANAQLFEDRYFGRAAD
jgi:hypothetical protein